jgi:signal transduction histidine kinase
LESLTAENYTGVVLLKRYFDAYHSLDIFIKENIKDSSSSNYSIPIHQWELINQQVVSTLNDIEIHNIKLLEETSNLYQSVIDQIQILTVLFMSLMIIIIFGLFNYLKLVITNPINKLRLATTEIIHDKYELDLPPSTNDDIGRLSENIQDMAKHLNSYHQYLESRIQKKERELVKSKILEQQKNDFISIASHELKTPITTLKMFAQLLGRADIKLHPDQVDRIGHQMNSHLDRLTKLVSDLLDVSRIQTGKLQLEKTDFDIASLVTETVEQLQVICVQHKLQIASSKPTIISADKEKIRQVLTNLLTNAVKYSPKSNKVIITVSHKNGKVVISIKDYGVGISSHFHKKIFQRFYRVGQTSNSSFPGLGMGLYIAYDIVKRHQGEMWLKSRLDHGSTFYFSLPIKQ